MSSTPLLRSRRSSFPGIVLLAIALTCFLVVLRQSQAVNRLTHTLTPSLPHAYVTATRRVNYPAMIRPATSRFSAVRGAIRPCRAEEATVETATKPDTQSSQSEIATEISSASTSTLNATQAIPEPESPMPSKFTRKQGVALATGLVSIGLGFAYIIGSEIVGGRELKEPPPEALQP
eukprot:CAMPEP_0114500500 /NCGR_PEP_ID=MMETSP0109-20121206/7999_1 /TAXON_ID=29199 /ORGANISM="Chlorarachnion reptans, Strain CCCM449" /LENGTH=176 /DNA_ID=CAMNT_0001678169 /DNA_START=31 /DNA_END=561 /DNA_ORIENTATION=-